MEEEREPDVGRAERTAVARARLGSAGPRQAGLLFHLGLLSTDELPRTRLGRGGGERPGGAAGGRVKGARRTLTDDRPKWRNARSPSACTHAPHANTPRAAPHIRPITISASIWATQPRFFFFFFNVPIRVCAVHDVVLRTLSLFVEEQGGQCTNCTWGVELARLCAVSPSDHD